MNMFRLFTNRKPNESDGMHIAQHGSIKEIVGQWCKPKRCLENKNYSLGRDTPPKRPDLSIYSQTFEYANGRTPTWSNKDIKHYYRGSEGNLKGIIIARIHNNSSTPAVNTRVRCQYREFGIGTPLLELSVVKTKILANASSEVVFEAPGSWDVKDHIGIRVSIQHEYDMSPGDNVGEDLGKGYLTSVYTKSFTTSVPIVNPHLDDQEISLSVVSELNVAIDWTARTFQGLERFVANVSIEVPASIPVGAYKSVVLLALDQSGSLLGGISLTVNIDN